MSKIEEFPVYSAPLSSVDYIAVKLKDVRAKAISKNSTLHAPAEYAKHEDFESRRRNRRSQFEPGADGAEVREVDVKIENKWHLEDPIANRRYGGFNQREENDLNVFLVFNETTRSFYISQPETLHLVHESTSRWKTMEEADEYMKQRRTAGRNAASSTAESDDTTGVDSSNTTNVNAILALRAMSSTFGGGNGAIPDAMQPNHRTSRRKIIKTDTEYGRFDDDEGAVVDSISDQEYAEDDDAEHRSFKQKLEERKSAKLLKMDDYDEDERDAEGLVAGKWEDKGYVSESDSESDYGGSSGDEDEGTTSTKKAVKRSNASISTTEDDGLQNTHRDMKRLKLSKNKNGDDSGNVEDDITKKYTRANLERLYTQRMKSHNLSLYEVALSPQELFQAFFPGIDPSKFSKSQVHQFKNFINSECRTEESPSKVYYLKKTQR